MVNHFHKLWMTLPLLDLVFLLMVFIGHTRLTYRFLLAGEPPPACPSCACPLTVHHVLVSCPQYATAHSMAFGHYFSMQEPLSLAGLLGDAGCPPIKRNLFVYSNFCSLAFVTFHLHSFFVVVHVLMFWTMSGHYIALVALCP